MFEVAVLGLMAVGALVLVGVVGLALLLVKLIWFVLLPVRLLFWMLFLPVLFVIKAVAGLLLIPIVLIGVVVLGGLALLALALPLIPILLLVALVWALTRSATPVLPAAS